MILLTISEINMNSRLTKNPLLGDVPANINTQITDANYSPPKSHYGQSHYSSPRKSYSPSSRVSRTSNKSDNNPELKYTFASYGNNFYKPNMSHFGVLKDFKNLLF